MQPIAKTLYDFIEAESCVYSLKVVQEHPEVLEEGSFALLQQMIQEAEQKGDVEESNKLKSRQELLSRCREVDLAQIYYETVVQANNLPSVPAGFKSQIDDAQRATASYLMHGDISFINRAISILTIVQEHPDFSAAPTDFRLALIRVAGETYAQRYWFERRKGDIEKAISLWTSILENADSNSGEYAQASLRMWALSSKLRELYQRSEELWELDAAIQANEQAAKHSPSNSRHHYRFHKWAMSLMDRYEMTGTLHDLELAIEAWEEALSKCVPNSPEAVLIMGNIGSALVWHYDHTGNSSSIEKARRYLEEAKRNTPDDSGYLSSRLSNLSAALSEVYLRTGSSDELDQAIEMYMQTVDREKPDSPHFSAYLNNLATALGNRFDREGNLVDLNNAISTCERALQIPNLSKIMRTTILNNYSEYLRRRYERRKNLEDIDNAIGAGQAALSLQVTNPILQAAIFNNLGNALSARHHLSRERRDLELSIEADEEALRLTPPNSPSIPARLNNLSNVLRERFILTGDLNDLNRAVSLCENAVAKIEPSSPQRVTLLDNLANALRERFTLTGYSDDKAQAIEGYEQAVKLGLALAIGEGLRSARNWGQWAFERRDWEEAARAFSYAQKASEQLFRIQLIRSDKESWLRETQGIADLAAYAFAKNGQLEDAVTVLEQGRARLLTEILERDLADLQELRELQPELYDRYTQAAERVASLGGEEYEPRIQPLDYVAEAIAARSELDATIQNIQSIPGFEGFFAVPSFANIQTSIQSLVDSTAVVYLSNTRVGSLALIVGTDWIETVWLDFSENNLRLVLGEYVPYIFSDDLDDADEAIERVLPVIGAELMAPIAQWLHRHTVTGIVLIPAGGLALLPLHAAEYSKNGNVCYLLDEFDVSYTPNIRGLDIARREFSRRNNEVCFVGIGNPMPHPQPLEGAEAELEKVARFFGENTRNTLYGEEAIKQALLNVIQKATHLHFACHGLFNVETPLDSRLELAAGEMLTLREVIYTNAQPVNAGLIVISACESGITDYRDLPDEFVGLPTGFLQAGVPRIVATLWSIDDRAASLLMVKFYEYLLQGDVYNAAGPMHPAHALRRAQIWLRDVTAAELIAYYEAELLKPDQDQSISSKLDKDALDELRRVHSNYCPFSHPTYWAAFTFTGYSAHRP